MELFFSLALLIVSTLATLSAFGGKTWREGSEPMIERITPRGWISLLCLATSVAFGVCKEIYSEKQNTAKDSTTKIAAITAKADADKKQAELQDKLTAAQGLLNVANTKLEFLKREAKSTEDEITGGDGFPIADIIALMPDNGSFPLRVTVHGKAPLSEVSYTIVEGVYKPPTPEEQKKMLQEAIDQVNGHGVNPSHFVGTVNPAVSIPMNYIIHPSMTDVSTYRINFMARNGSVFETLEVRFNKSLSIWQSRYETKSERAKDPNKVLAKVDWNPRMAFPMPTGNGRPH